MPNSDQPKPKPGGFVRELIRARKDGKKAGSSRARANAKTGIKPVSPVIISLIEAISHDDIDSVLRVWREAMNANMERFDGAAKAWVLLPDHRTRLEASKIVAAYREGLPMQRQVVLNANFSDLSQDLQSLKTSPEAMRVLQSMAGDSLQKTALGDESGETDKPATREEG